MNANILGTLIVRLFWKPPTLAELAFEKGFH
jgi:hypothetical protein